MPYIPEIKIGNTTYKVKDQESWEEFENLKSAFNNILSKESFDYTDATLTRYFILNTGKWSASSGSGTARSYTFAIPSAVKIVRITPNQNGAIVAFMNSYSPATGDDVDFADGYEERISLVAGQTYEYAVKGNMKYFYALITDSSGNDRTPTVDLCYIYTDSTLEIENAPADSKTVGDKISEITNTINHLYMIDDSYDFDGVSLSKWVITSSNEWNVAGSSNPMRSYTYLIPEDAISVEVTGNADGGSAIAFLQTNSSRHTVGDTPDYAPGTSRIVINAEETTKYTIGTGMKYLYATIYNSSGDDRTPTLSFLRIKSDGEGVDNLKNAFIKGRKKIHSLVYASMEATTETWWDEEGGHQTEDDPGYCSKPMAINPGEPLYFGIKTSNLKADGCIGAFLDYKQDWIKTLTVSDLEAYSYKKPNAITDNLQSYIDMFRTKSGVVPADAFYFSFNMLISSSAGYQYREYVTNKPMTAYRGYGNLVVYEDDPAIYAKGNKKLCIIGPSTAMIDRLYRTGYMDRERYESETQSSEYIVGWQEYLMPFYESVTTYGYSGSAWPVLSESTDKESIYSYVTGDGLTPGATIHPVDNTPLDLSGYDEFIIMTSGNGYSQIYPDYIGEYNSTDENTYFGALNAVIDMIFTQNPSAKVYLMNAMRGSSDPDKIAFVSEINEKIATLSDAKSLELLDRASGCGFNSYTYPGWSYDDSHYNQEGSKVLGLWVRRMIVGI